MSTLPIEFYKNNDLPTISKTCLQTGGDYSLKHLREIAAELSQLPIKNADILYAKYGKKSETDYYKKVQELKSFTYIVESDVIFISALCEKYNATDWPDVVAKIKSE